MDSILVIAQMLLLFKNANTIMHFTTNFQIKDYHRKSLKCASFQGEYAPGTDP